MSSERLKLPLRGLASPACVPEVEGLMRGLHGVIWAAVNFAAEEATVIYDPADFEVDALIAALRQLGYDTVLGRPEMAGLRATIAAQRRRLQPRFPWQAWR